MTDEQEVCARLAALPSPPMPEDVVAGIENRLAAERGVTAITPRHVRRLNWLVAAAAVLGFLVLVGLSDRAQPAPVTASEPIVRTGASFVPPGFGEQVKQRIQQGAAGQRTDTFADSPHTIHACATAIQAYGRVLFLDTGTYDQKAAVVMVTTYPADSEYEEIWVVSPDCGASDPVVIRHVLMDVTD